MTKQAALYARVSQPATQDAKDKVSITQQLADQRALCERNGWQVVGEFVDNENYKATQSPHKGKAVNPSGERADRPRFLAMLGVIKAGDADIVLCWRDDRLVRHPRVAVALEDALDIGDATRNGKPKIEIRDATGAMIDRFTLSIKATIWREENKRRVERTNMGKIATLEQGRWPGTYHRYGYLAVKAEGRGRIIEKVEDEAQVVLTIHEMFDAENGVTDIRNYLRRNGIPQKGYHPIKHEWNHSTIYDILHGEEYTGFATWNFKDGTTKSVEIPVIVPRELWEKNQARIERNKELSTRNAKGVYLLQNLVFCGDCGRAMTTRLYSWYYKNNERRERKSLQYRYYCPSAAQYPNEPHPGPTNRNGVQLDWQVWRQLVDNSIKRPDIISAYILGRQAELQAQGESVDGDIAHACRRLAEIAEERKAYHKQVARGRMTEQEYDELIAETEESRQYWESELARLKELRDNRDKVQAGLDYVNRLMANIEKVLPVADIPPDELNELPEERQAEILEIRQGIIRALVDKVEVWASGQVLVHGLLDGSEAAQFELRSLPW